MIGAAEFSSRSVEMLRQATSEAFVVPFAQLPRIFFHAVILAFIISSFWLLDSLKDPVLASTVGITYQPIAKLLSVFTTLIVVCCYDLLTSLVKKTTLFHIISCFFGFIFFVIAALLADEDYGLNNPVHGPGRYLGWICYFSIEAYGSLMVALFWSFTNSLMDLEQAKGAYGLIISVAQCGAIVGSSVATTVDKTGIPKLFLVGSISVLLVSLLIKVYHLVFRDRVTVNVSNARVRSYSLQSDTSTTGIASDPLEGTGLLVDDLPKPPGVEDTQPRSNSIINVCGGFYEGLTLIIRHRYVFLLLCVSVLDEIVITVLDYQFKVIGSHSTSMHEEHISMHDVAVVVDAAANVSDAEDGVRFVHLLAKFGQMTNVLSLLLSFFGFSFLVNKMGMRFSLLILPCILMCAVVVTNLSPNSLTLYFVSVSVIKALLFSLYDPVKELYYLPTSEPIKFKAKAWIDVFGCRFAKALGSIISVFSHGNHVLSEIPCIVISVLLILCSWQLGVEFQEIERTGVIIGDEDEFVLNDSEMPEKQLTDEPAVTVRKRAKDSVEMVNIQI